MSGLQARGEDAINGVDVREQGSALRVATNTPHLVSLGTGRLSTAVTLHPIKQGRVTIGSDPTCDIYVVGTGVASVHCRVENSHGVVTLYPTSGSTLLDGLPVDKPTRLSQGSMLTIGRSNYLRFNHPEEAKLMKSVLPSAHVSMAPVQYQPNENCLQTDYQDPNRCYQNANIQTLYKDHTLSQLDRELDMTLNEIAKKKPPAVPRKPYVESDSDQESKPKMSSIMAKVSKFEYYAKQQKVGKSQFYTSEDEISPKVFSSNSLTVNTPAKDVLGGRNVPNYMKRTDQKIIVNDNNSVEKNRSYTNVAVRKTKINDIVRNFDEGARNEFQLKKVNNDQVRSDVYGKINNRDEKSKPCDGECGKANGKRPCLPSPAFDRNPQYSPVYANTYDRGYDAESRRIKAYQDRVKEEEQKEAETARLEEILSMCAEYERQIAAGTPITPTEKRPHNKIITNGSLPRSVVLNNPNIVQTSEGYYKFETGHNQNGVQSLPNQRNLSRYENLDSPPPGPRTPGAPGQGALEQGARGRMDEIGIPVFDEDLASPVMIRKTVDPKNLASPIGSPYENVYYNRASLKPKSPNSQSPRTRIKTTFAHKNVASPQYFVFPTPPPADNSKPSFNIPNPTNNGVENVDTKENEKVGIEKQLSLEEDIPMIDDADVTNDVEQRHSRIITEKEETQPQNSNTPDNEVFTNEKTLTKNQSFDDVKKELMADIPELEEFEKDLEHSKREKMLKQIQSDVKQIDFEADSIDSTLDVSMVDLKARYDTLKEERKKLMTEIHEIKCKMSEIRSQEDDILRELEMEKALIKGEYDSEIAILNIEQRKKEELAEQGRRIEEQLARLRETQGARQTDMRERVAVATMEVERIERAMSSGAATLEELQNAKDILDNETKIHEDLEFQHLEQESELLANREDLQNEITLLTKKIEGQKTRILTLKSEANSNLTSALNETKILQAEYVRLLNQVEELTSRVQAKEKELKPVIAKMNDLERTQSPDSAFYTDQTRTKSGEFGYSPQSSDSDDLEAKVSQFEEHTNVLKDKFNSIDQMSRSMIVDIERRACDSPKSSTSKEKKGFWERNFDSLKRRSKRREGELMSQSLNENLFGDNIENESLDRFNSLRRSKSKGEPKSASSKIPTLSALGKIIKKDSFGKKSRDAMAKEEPRNRYVKNAKPSVDNKYAKAKSLSPDKKTDIREDESEPRENPRVLHRRSCGDEVREARISDSGKVPSQDDIDRISRVTADAPILSSDTDVNSLGRRTLDSLMEIERKRMEMLEEQGCQVIEDEREKISELKRRVQHETKRLWDQGYRSEQARSFDSDCQADVDRRAADDSVSAGRVCDESSGFMSSSIEELQVRNSRAESTEDEKRSDDSRPLSLASDFSRDNSLVSGAPRRSRRGTAPGESQRPLTRYLPVDRDDFDLRRHIESAGHQIDLCPHVTVTATACRGYLHKLGAKFHTWSKRWFVFDRESKTFIYYWDKTERKPRGGAYFQVIEEVYPDHANASRSPSPRTTLVVQTRRRRYHLLAPSGEAARVWIDALCTGAQGRADYLE